MLGKTKCPYCKEVLAQKPKRKKKCSHCGKPIYVRKGRLMTEDEATTQEWLGFLSQFGITRKCFESHRKSLTMQFGFEAPVYDTIWRVLNSLVTPKRSRESLQAVYWLMARLVRGEGKDPKPYLAQAVKLELENLKLLGIKTVRITNVGFQRSISACAVCQELHGQRFGIEQALRELPVPMRCENPDGCRCEYVSDERWKDLTKREPWRAG